MVPLEVDIGAGDVMENWYRLGLSRLKRESVNALKKDIKEQLNNV